jgi:phosphate-selective porin OprO and OprP
MIDSRSLRRRALRARLCAGGLAAGLLGLASPALAQAVATAPPPPPPADLQEQVRSLSSMVQSLSQQVQSLQAQLDARGPVNPTPSDVVQPRAAQNTVPGFTLSGGSERRVANAERAEPRVLQNETHIFSLASPDGEYSISLAGIAQFDAGDYLSFSPRSHAVGPQQLSNGVNARRARIGFTGKAGGDWSYAFIYDGGNSQDTTARGIETAQIVYGGFKGLALEIGYSNTFFTLDQATSSADLMFNERASPSNIATNFNTGDNRSNVGFRFFGDRYWLGAYLTGPVASSDSHTNVGERLGSFQRAAFQVLKGKDYNVHLGVGVDELLQGPTTGAGTPQTVSLSDQPELRIDPTTLLNTGTIGTLAHPFNGGYVLDLETAAVWKSLFWQGEYYHYDVGRRGLADADFDGAYGQIAWALTGESHRYNPQAGAYYRLYPAHPFSLKDGGLGALEIAGRISYVDLNSRYNPAQALSAQPAAIDGGRQTGYSIALNWYPNDLLRFMLDYNHTDFDKRNGAAVTGAPLGVQVGDTFDAVSLRSQIVF